MWGIEDITNLLKIRATRCPTAWTAASQPTAHIQCGTLQVGSTIARNWYNSLQLKFEKRRTEGWYTLASYTFSSAIDQGGAWGAAPHRSSGRLRRRKRPAIADAAAELHPGQRLRIALRPRPPLRVQLEPRDGRLPGRLAGLEYYDGTDRPALNVTLEGTGTNPATDQQYKFLNLNRTAELCVRTSWATPKPV